jgi:hypothetical protein
METPNPLAVIAAARRLVQAWEFEVEERDSPLTALIAAIDEYDEAVAAIDAKENAAG